MSISTRDFDYFNDRMWGYGSTISALRRKVERLEATDDAQRRITALEAEVEALRAENKGLLETWLVENMQARKWQARAYAEEKPAVDAGEVHELRERLVDHLAVVAERDKAQREVADLRAAVETARKETVDWMHLHAEVDIELRAAREKIAAMKEEASIARHEAAHKERAAEAKIAAQGQTIASLHDRVDGLVRELRGRSDEDN